MLTSLEIWRNQSQWSSLTPPYNLSIPLDFLSSPHKSGFVELEVNVEIKLSFIRGVDEYYWEMIRVIEELRGKSWMYKEISDHLKSRGFVSRRGKPLSLQLVERMYKNISIELIKS